METVLIAVALTVGVAGLVLALSLRSRLDALERAAAASQSFEQDARRGHEALYGELGETKRLLDQTRRELDAARGELDELKAAAEILPPPPPLPKAARPGSLDDLRQQLRAAHQEPDVADDA
jgi:hypothetical protein